MSAILRNVKMSLKMAETQLQCSVWYGMVWYGMVWRGEGNSFEKKYFIYT